MTSAPLARHGKCGSTWTGLSVSHCGKCCKTFSSVSAFDEHWRGSQETCSDPATKSLVPVEKKWGTCWSWPSSGSHPYAAAEEQEEDAR